MKKTKSENLKGWLTVGPILLYYAVFGLVPLGIVLGYSLMEKERGLFGKMSFVGLKNFVTIFTDATYYRPILTTALIAVFTIGFSIVFGLLFAKLMSGQIRGKGFYRTVYYVPVVISMGVVAQIVNVWLSYNSGFNNILLALGKDPVKWVDSAAWTLFWIILICLWKGLGATVILFVAGLSAISPDIYEAADLDGAGRMRKFFQVTLPQLRPMMVFVLITSIIGAFNIFEPVQLISTGTAQEDTMVILYQIYQKSFLDHQLTMGSALSVVLLVIMLILTGLNMKFGESKD